MRFYARLGALVVLARRDPRLLIVTGWRRRRTGRAGRGGVLVPRRAAAVPAPRRGASCATLPAWQLQAGRPRRTPRRERRPAPQRSRPPAPRRRGAADDPAGDAADVRRRVRPGGGRVRAGQRGRGGRGAAGHRRRAAADRQPGRGRAADLRQRARCCEASEDVVREARERGVRGAPAAVQLAAARSTRRSTSCASRASGCWCSAPSAGRSAAGASAAPAASCASRRPASSGRTSSARVLTGARVDPAVAAAFPGYRALGVVVRRLRERPVGRAHGGDPARRRDPRPRPPGRRAARRSCRRSRRGARPSRPSAPSRAASRPRRRRC